MTPPRVAVVSGGAAGIGLAIARRLVADGRRVAVFGPDEGEVAGGAAVLEAEAGADRVHAACADLRDPASVAAFFAGLQARWGAAGILVHNAGVSPKAADGRRRALVDTPLEEWDQVLRVNLTGGFLCCREALPGMLSAGWGRIVFIGSQAGRTAPRIAGAAYAASKAGLAGLMRAVAAEGAGRGVTASLVAPGRIVTAMAGDPGSAVNRAALERIPAGRLGGMDDVARVVGLLTAEDGAFLNGLVVDVNGGEFMAP